MQKPILSLSRICPADTSGKALALLLTDASGNETEILIKAESAAMLAYGATAYSNIRSSSANDGTSQLSSPTS